MLREIINYTKHLSPENRQLIIELPEGLYISTMFFENKLVIKEVESYSSGNDKSEFLKKVQKILPSTMCVSSRKKLDSPFKLNASSSPFCIIYDKDSFVHKLLKTNIEEYFKKLHKNVIEYCKIKTHQEFTSNFLLNINKYFLDELIKMEDFQALRKNDLITIVFALPQISDFEQCHSNYLAKKVFNKEIFNVKIGDNIFGVSDYLSQFPDKKPFFLHKTAPFDISNRLVGEDALFLFKFYQMQRNKILPNPLPIFIDKRELNDEVVSIFNREGEKGVTFIEIIRELFNRGDDLGNYYLFNFWGRNQIIVHDFDFVSSFRFYLSPKMKIINLFQIKNLDTIKIKDIFEFERKIVQIIFDKQLILKTKDDKWRYRYFDEIEYKPQYIRATMYQLVLKYRKAFYDYIYKSRQNAITNRIFHDILQTGILDDLKQDVFKDNQHSMNFRIKNKLNIWFSLYEYFDQKPQTNGEMKMAERIKSLQGKMDLVATQKESHLEDDNDFAFAAGQVIYYLLNCSETSNKTHALLEPFLQKVDPAQFKLAVSRTFNQYKHAITFYKGKFEKLMAEVLSYELEGNLKSLIPMILAGYFSDNVIYKKIESAQKSL